MWFLRWISKFTCSLLQLVIQLLYRKGYDIGKKERPPFIKDANPETVDENEEHPVPAECCCTLCDDLLVDAVVISCCGNTFCDDCQFLAS